MFQAERLQVKWTLRDDEEADFVAEVTVLRYLMLLIPEVCDKMITMSYTSTKRAKWNRSSYYLVSTLQISC